MSFKSLVLHLLLCVSAVLTLPRDIKHVVVTTWTFDNATRTAWGVIDGQSGTAVDAVVAGSGYCEMNPWDCGYSVGYGGKPDEDGEPTLDAMIMDGATFDVGAVVVFVTSRMPSESHTPS